MPLSRNHIQETMDSGGCICALDNSATISFRCGNCNIGFSMICQLHEHLKSHIDDNGSYSFFFKTRVAFAEKTSENVSMVNDYSLKSQVKKGNPTIIQKRTSCKKNNKAQMIIKTEASDSSSKCSERHSEKRKRTNSNWLKLRDINGKKLPDGTNSVISANSYKVMKERSKQTVSLVSKSDHLDGMETDLNDITEKENEAKTDPNKPMTRHDIGKEVQPGISAQPESQDTDKDEQLHESNEDKLTYIVPKPNWKSVRSMGVGTIEAVEPFKKRKRRRHIVSNTFETNDKTLDDSDSEDAAGDMDDEVMDEPDTSTSHTIDDKFNKDGNGHDMTDKDTELSICNVCAKVFPTRRHMLLHRRVHKEYQTLQCHMCPSSFHGSREYTRHLQTHIDYRPFVCGVCDKRFHGERDLVLHRERIHMGLLKYQCEFCERAFTDGSSFRAHHATHFEPTLKCQFCEKKFRHRNTLVKHERTHSDTKYFQCHICDRGFNQCTPYFQHMDKTHDLNKRYLKDIMKCVAEARRREGLRLDLYRVPDDIEEIISKLRREDEKEVAKDVGQGETMKIISRKAVTDRVTAPASIVLARTVDESDVPVEESERETQILPQTVLSLDDEEVYTQGRCGVEHSGNVLIYSVQGGNDGNEQAANSYYILVDNTQTV